MCVGGWEGERGGAGEVFHNFFSLFHRLPWVNGLFMGGDGGSSAWSCEGVVGEIS